VFIVFPAVLLGQSYTPEPVFEVSWLISMLFQSQNEYLSTVKLTKERFWEIRFFSMFLLYSFIRKRGFLMDIDLKEELKKRDELLAGYLKL
jgi:hypothetical protein